MLFCCNIQIICRTQLCSRRIFFNKIENEVIFDRYLYEKHIATERNDRIRCTLVACVWCLNLLW